MPRKRITNRLFVLRAERGRMTQTQLGRRSGLSQFVIHQIETGKREATKAERELIARALGVTVAELQFSAPAPDEELSQVAS